MGVKTFAGNVMGSPLRFARGRRGFFESFLVRRVGQTPRRAVFWWTRVPHFKGYAGQIIQVDCDVRLAQFLNALAIDCSQSSDWSTHVF